MNAQASTTCYAPWADRITHTHPHPLRRKPTARVALPAGRLNHVKRPTPTRQVRAHSRPSRRTRPRRHGAHLLNGLEARPAQPQPEHTDPAGRDDRPCMAGHHTGWGRSTIRSLRPRLTELPHDSPHQRQPTIQASDLHPRQPHAHHNRMRTFCTSSRRAAYGGPPRVGRSPAALRLSGRSRPRRPRAHCWMGATAENRPANGSSNRTMRATRQATPGS